MYLTCESTRKTQTSAKNEFLCQRDVRRRRVQRMNFCANESTVAIYLKVLLIKYYTLGSRVSLTVSRVTSDRPRAYPVRTRTTVSLLKILLGSDSPGLKPYDTETLTTASGSHQRRTSHLHVRSHTCWCVCTASCTAVLLVKYDVRDGRTCQSHTPLHPVQEFASALTPVSDTVGVDGAVVRAPRGEHTVRWADVWRSQGAFSSQSPWTLAKRLAVALRTSSTTCCCIACLTAFGYEKSSFMEMFLLSDS